MTHPAHPQRRQALRQGCGLGLNLGLLALGSASAPRLAQASGTHRLVSLSGGMTETLWALGAADTVVATDTTSNWPQAARDTPKVGYMRQLSAEGILALRPTAVLGTHEVGPPAVMQQLAQAGISLVLVQASHRFDEVLAKVDAAARTTGRLAAGQALAERLQASWQQALAEVEHTRARRAAKGQSAPRVLFMMCHAGRAMSAGVGTAAHAMLNYAGATHALEAASGYKALSAEALVLARPDLLVTTQESIEASGGIEGFWRLPGLAQTPAGRQRALRVHDTQALLGFGPRTPQALLDLHRSLA